MRRHLENARFSPPIKYSLIVILSLILEEKVVHVDYLGFAGDGQHFLRLKRLLLPDSTNNERVCIFVLPLNVGVIVKLLNCLHIFFDLCEVEHVLVSAGDKEDTQDEDHRAGQGLGTPVM